MGRALTVALLWLAACGAGDESERELVDDGWVCVQLQPSGTVRVDVTFRDCLTSCDVAQPASCSVTKEAGEDGAVVLRVSSRGVVKQTGASVCSRACGRLQASCSSTEPFAPGALTVRHGPDEAGLSLGTQAQCLFED